jgi:hypothetical protein
VLDLGLSTAYLFRGYNIFQRSSQWDQHPFAAPSVSYTIPGVDGLAIGYWGAYQLVGPNVQAALDAGLGAENDLWVSYSHTLFGPLSGGLGFTAYVFPVATQEAAGTQVPAYLEPAIFASVASVLDAGIKVAYFHALQDAIGAYRYLYLNPTLGKTLTFNDWVALALSASGGYKLFIDGSSDVAQANTLDLLLSAALPVALAGPVYVRPSLSWAWTNLPDRSLTEGMTVFAGLNLGASL